MRRSISCFSPPRSVHAVRNRVEQERRWNSVTMAIGDLRRVVSGWCTCSCAACISRASAVSLDCLQLIWPDSPAVPRVVSPPSPSLLLRLPRGSLVASEKFLGPLLGPISRDFFSFKRAWLSSSLDRKNLLFSRRETVPLCLPGRGHCAPRRRGESSLLFIAGKDPTFFCSGRSFYFKSLEGRTCSLYMETLLCCSLRGRNCTWFLYRASLRSIDRRHVFAGENFLFNLCFCF